MNAILLVSVVFMTACAVTGNPLKESRGSDAIARHNRAVDNNYEPVGCFSFRSSRKKIFGKQAYKKIKKGPESPIDECKEGKDYAIIGIQKKKNMIVCRKGNEQEWKLAVGSIKSLDAKQCKGNVGSKKSIFIYKKSENPGINQQCVFADKVYNNGQEAKMYHETGNIQNAYCEVCECLQGRFSDCYNMSCDIGLQSCAEIIHPPDQCCPKCQSASARKKCSGNQHSWLSYENNICLLCECSVGQEFANCKKVTPYCQDVSCKDPVIPAGECCPYCEPEATTQPFFTIKPTKKRPPPTFPFPF